MDTEHTLCGARHALRLVRQHRREGVAASAAGVSVAGSQLWQWYRAKVAFDEARKCSGRN